LQNLTSKIETWAIVRKLHEADPSKQIIKLGEEYGELCKEFNKTKSEEVKDAIGDMYVVLTILALQLGLNVEDCIEADYEEIKERKGKMINGVFVKEADLNDN